MQAGIDGYLGKDIEPQEFEEALHNIRFGRRHISEAIAHDLALPMATCRIIPFNSYRCGKCR